MIEVGTLKSKKDSQYIGKIFKELRSGRVINKQTIESSGFNFVENMDFAKIAESRNKFDFLAETVGGVIEEGDGYYILANRDGDSNEKCLALKSKFFITMLSMSNYSSSESAGVGFENPNETGMIEKKEFIDYVTSNEIYDYETALFRIEKNLTFEKLLKELIKLGFLFENQNGLKLTYYGYSIYKEMLKNYKVENNT